MANEKTALVTAAGRGIGAAIARELAGAGFYLILLSASGGAESLASELGGVGLTGSVTDPGDLQKMVDLAMAKTGRIDAVINNTGHPPKGPLLDIPDQDWYNGLDLLLLNVVRMARLVTPIMQNQGGGAIVNISTFSAYEPSESFPVSSTLRAGLGAFTKMYADRYAADGIRMNNILPGYVDNYPESQENLRKIPMGRYARSDEIARTALFLVSDGAGYITGQNIRVDGGITRSV